jgi:ABC-type glycerol-3-phosphate transport system substrate-binding protein
MSCVRRRAIFAGAAAAALALPARAQRRPDRLVFVGTNSGQFHGTVVEEVAPAFERQHGIKVEFNLLPVDALATKLRAELGARSSSIDVAQFAQLMVPWMAPHLEDHTALLTAAASRNADYDWDDFLPPVQDMAKYDDRLVGIPYRANAQVLFFQRPVLEQAGIQRPPQTFDEFRTAALAITRAGAPNRHGAGFAGRQGPAMYPGFAPILLAALGGHPFDPKTREILVNRPEAVRALDFYAGLLTRDRVVPPDVMTWEYDEVIANGQSDRYGMAVTNAPYGSLMNDPALSRTGGRWAFALSPGADDISESKCVLGGWIYGVPRYARHKEWAFEFIQLATNQHWLRRSMYRGNAAPRTSVLMDPAVQAAYPWAPVAAEAYKTGEQVPQDPVWAALEQRLRLGISQTLLGQATARAALDAVAADWQRSLRRASGTR